MTQETPAKVFSLLGVALTSMFFLFAVSVTNANFSQTETAFPGVFNPDSVVAVLDSAAGGYSQFVQANLVKPAQQSYAIYQYNLKFVIDESAPSILAFTGLSSLAQVNSSQSPRVAGAYTSGTSYQTQRTSGGLNVDSLYSMLIR